MANAAGKLFASFLESKEIKCKVLEEDMSVLSVGWKLDNTRMTVFFKFNDEGTNVHIEGHEFLSVPEDKYGKVLVAVNAMNIEYRWVKFTLNTERSEVVAEDDAVIQLDSCAEESFELMLRMNNIVDEAFPAFQKAMWA